MADHSLWMEITNRMFLQEPFTADAICSHAWGDQHDAVIDYIAKLYIETKAHKIILNGLSEYEIDAKGIEYWRDRLTTKHHIDVSAIIATMPSKQTRDEAEAFADELTKGEYRTVALVSVPHHILRVFLTNVAVAKERNLPVKFIPRTLPTSDWNEKITIRGFYRDADVTMRVGRFAAEIARIHEYRRRFENGEKGFGIASVEEGLEHLSKH